MITAHDTRLVTAAMVAHHANFSTEVDAEYISKVISTEASIGRSGTWVSIYTDAWRDVTNHEFIKQLELNGFKVYATINTNNVLLRIDWGV